MKKHEEKMRMVYEGLKYINEKFDDWVRKDLIIDSIGKLTMEQFLFMTNPEFSESLMYSIRDAFLEGLTIEQVSLLSKVPDDKYADENRDDVIRVLDKGVDIKLVDFLVTKIPDSRYEYFDLYCSILINNKDNELLHKYTEIDFPQDRFEHVLFGIDDGLSEKKINLMIDPKVDIEIASAILNDEIMSEHLTLLSELGLELD